MRRDSVGFFWNDTPPPKPPKAEKPKRTPPERTWELPTYLPGLEEARAFPVGLLGDAELSAAYMAGERLVLDTECYPNYWLVAFTSLTSGKVIYFERTATTDFNHAKLEWILKNFCTVGFNSLKYDLPMIALALAGASNELLKACSDRLIVEEARGADVLRSMKAKSLKLDHIDLFEVAPGVGSGLKAYAGRMHAPRMQDLPFAPGTVLNDDQIAIVRWYCVNDIRNTAQLYETLQEQVSLRESMTAEYGVDLRSKSDAQIAEAVITHELERALGHRIRPPVILPGTTYRYKVPHFIRYESSLMNWALDIVRNAVFVVSENGNIGLPPELSNLELAIAGGVYRMGIGGLHSSESRVAHHTDDQYELFDRDVTSFYPWIILLLKLYPHHLGPVFLDVYERIVQRRVKAKHDGLKVIADSLKIVVNGSFGKLGNRFSNFYAPDLLIQTTLTGQLSLLMLIERLELAGISVVSANTDGVVIKCPRHLTQLYLDIVAQWERDTGFGTEETRYRSVYSRDVNNYIAVKPDGKAKLKGVYAPPGLQKNPTNTICMDAVLAHLTQGVPIDHTIRTCQDIRKFVGVRYAKGGAVKNGNYLGKVVRWYYGVDGGDEIVYARNGNAVARSKGAVPVMELPKVFPADVDFDWYVQEANKILVEVGASS